MMVRIFDKMKDERKKMILSEADKFIKQITIYCIMYIYLSNICPVKVRDPFLRNVKWNL